jgi:hypothetical protein
MPYMIVATATETRKVNKLALYPFIFFRIRAQKINRIGNDASNADNARLDNGSMTCVQFIDTCFND